MDTVRIALAQINVRVGDIRGNLKKILSYIRTARDSGVDVLAFPELAITGYPPEDLLLKPNFIQDSVNAIDEVRKLTGGITVVLGYPEQQDSLYNAAAVLHNKELVDVYRKHYLPNYGVFDEERYFKASRRVPVYKIGNFIFGVNICEDIWYPGDPTRKQSFLGGAQVIINISSSPYYSSKVASREQMLVTRAKTYSVVVAFCNLIGGQDELVFDGHSVVVGERGEILARASGFKEELLISDIDIKKVLRSRAHELKGTKAPKSGSERPEVLKLKAKNTRRDKKPHLKPRVTEFSGVEEEILKALVLGTKDYVSKNGFKKVVIGLSGGIDSALVAAIATEALGRQNVVGISMPSKFSSKGSVTDTEKLSANLGIELRKIPIAKAYNLYINMLSDTFSGAKEGITEENLQARIRGNILMAVSNKFGWLVLTTGNKSEMSVGYCTIYGDMAGGFAVIKDVPKTMVFRLSRFINDYYGKEMIPLSIIEKPPSAELRPGQLDTDSLPPYDILDPILKAYVEDDLSAREIVALGFKEKLVKRVISMVDKNEYKRRQGPPGIKITARAFGKDRRFPITNLYRG
jgi:NAD+ synthase (glutamine-hydrolysing)